MIRAVAVSLAAVTTLFIDGILALVFGHAEDVINAIKVFQQSYGRLTAIVLNLVVVESLFVRERWKRDVQLRSHRMAENSR